MGLFGLLGGLFVGTKIEAAIDDGKPTMLGMGAALGGGYVVKEVIDELLDDDEDDDDEDW